MSSAQVKALALLDGYPTARCATGSIDSRPVADRITKDGWAVLYVYILLFNHRFYHDCHIFLQKQWTLDLLCLLTMLHLTLK